jgi:hypothetical protein
MRLLLPAPVRPTTPSLVLPGIVNDTSLQSYMHRKNEAQQHCTRIRLSKQQHIAHPHNVQRVVNTNNHSKREGVLRKATPRRRSPQHRRRTGGVLQKDVPELHPPLIRPGSICLRRVARPHADDAPSAHRLLQRHEWVL